MAHPDADALQRVLPLLRQLRDIPGVRETRPGIFHCSGAAFAQFQIEADALVAELKKPGGSGFERFPVDTAAGQRKFIDAARRRASRGDED